MTSTNSTVQALETLVRAGKLDEARRIFRTLTIKTIPRAEALAYANLARRLDFANLSVRILNPIVRSKKQRLQPATADELVEYAASLRNLGVIAEATEILTDVSAAGRPQAAFQLALCYFAEWRYRPSIELLRGYLQLQPPHSYFSHVGKVNLLQALIHEGEVGDAQGVVTELLEDVDRNRHSFLYQRSLELAAQFEISLKENWAQAFIHLNQARGLLDHAQDSIHLLLIRKWDAIAKSLQAGQIAPELLKVRKEAAKFKAWEIVRDCDFYSARIAQNREGLLHLYFGTPFESYRCKVLPILNELQGLPDVFTWRGEERYPPRKRETFELLKAQMRGADSVKLAAGQALHRFLIVLCQDFYKPALLLSLFSKIFPKEHFNPDTSPNRVHQMIFRFREWCMQNEVPINLVEENGSYRLSFSKSLGIAIPKQPLPLDPNELEFIRLRALLAKRGKPGNPGKTVFTAREVQAALDLSKTAVSLLLKWAVRAGKVEFQGHTNRAHYVLLPRE